MDNFNTVSAIKLAVPTSEGVYFYDPNDIIRLEASSNYTYIYFTNRKPLLISKVLGLYEELLSSVGFVRTHRSHLVNRNHIICIDQLGRVVMKDESRAEISRRKKREVLKSLKNYSATNSAAA